jgi:hypothetical protein
MIKKILLFLLLLRITEASPRRNEVFTAVFLHFDFPFSKQRSVGRSENLGVAGKVEKI